GDGKFVPSNHLQQVQYLEGGIIEEILVKPGEDVKKGQILVKLDPTQINAQFTQGRGGYHMLAARIARLEAAAAERAIVFPADLQRAAPDVVANERKLFEARRQEYEAALAVEAGKLAEAEAALAYASETHELAAQELAIVEPLVNKGIEPKLELIRARQRAAGALGEKQRAEIAVKNALSETDRIKSTYFASIADELGKARA